MSIPIEGFFSANPMLVVAIEALGATQHYRQEDDRNDNEVESMRLLAATVVSAHLRQYAQSARIQDA